MKGDFVCQENFVENFVAAKYNFETVLFPSLRTIYCFLDREPTSQYRGGSLRVITRGVRYWAKNT